MRSVKVNRNELLEKLKKNREKHRDIFLQAQEGYRKAVIAELDRMLEDAKAGKKIKRYIELEEPIDQTDDYDRAIAMLEMCVDDVVEINNTEFACYVMDQWSWKEQFTATNTVYLTQ